MKWIFGLLVLANAALFGVMTFFGGAAVEAESGHQPLNADKMVIVNPQSLSSAPAGSGTGGLPAAVPSGGAAAPASSPAPSVCLEWGLFAAADAQKAQTALASLNLGDRLTTETKGQPKGYWVYIPPLASKQDADRKIAELKGLGVNDYLLIREPGQWQYAISLGVLSNEEGARTLLAQLQKKGVKSAQMGPRTVSNDQTAFLIRNVPEDLMAKLVALRQSYPDTQLQAVPCP